MKIAGIQKLTLIDFPGKLACTVFLMGCNFRCPWCYNPELVLPQKIKKQSYIPEKEFFNFLKERKGFLEGVVLCGGEPTINKKLSQFCKKIKNFGFLVKIDTNGSNPKVLKNLIDKQLIDYVAMDVKAPKEKYNELTGVKVNIKKIQKSINILKESKINYEFRTTLVPKLLSKEDILKIAKWIGPARRYVLQNFLPKRTIDSKFEKIKPFSLEYLLKIQKLISPFFENCQIR